MNEDIIYSYTRKEAIEDGILIDVTEFAKEAGILYPVAITVTVWHRYIVPKNVLMPMGQALIGRLWDVLWLLRNKALATNSDVMLFQVNFIQEDKKSQTVTLKSICGPGDDGEPVITIMLPEED